MSVEISFGGVCRDVSLLPQDEAGFRSFYESFLAPALYEDFRKNFQMSVGQGIDVNRSYSAELQLRGCEVGGSVSVKF